MSLSVRAGKDLENRPPQVPTSSPHATDEESEVTLSKEQEMSGGPGILVRSQSDARKKATELRLAVPKEGRNPEKSGKERR